MAHLAAAVMLLLLSATTIRTPPATGAAAVAAAAAAATAVNRNYNLAGREPAATAGAHDADLLQLGPLEFASPPVLIATTPWTTCDGQSFYRLNATTIVGSTLSGGDCRLAGAGCTFASLDAGRTWREWAAGEHQKTVPKGYPRQTIDPTFFPVLGPMQWLVRGAAGTSTPYFSYGGWTGHGPNATHVHGGGYKAFRALASTGTVLQFPAPRDETGVPAGLAPTLATANITYWGLPSPVLTSDFCSEDMHGDMMETADGKLLHVVSVAFNPTHGCNYYECNRGGALNPKCHPAPSICNRGSIVAFRSVDGGHNWHFASIVANSSSYDTTSGSSNYSHEGIGEPDSAILPSGTVITVMRFDAGDACQWGPFPEDTKACYKNYRSSRSTDHGLHWSVPAEVPAGTARPRVASFGAKTEWLLLSGGRMFNQGRNDLGLWWSSDGGATRSRWGGTSLSYVHNLLMPNRSRRFDSNINSTSVRVTTAYTSLLRLTATNGIVIYDRQVHWWNATPPHLPSPLTQWFALPFRFVGDSSATLKTDDATSSCLSGISASGTLNTSTATVIGTCAGQSTADGSFVCAGPHKLVAMQHPGSFVGMADFSLSVSLKLEAGIAANGTAASVQVFSCEGQDSVGIDGNWYPSVGSNVFFLAGPHWGGNLMETTPCPPAGRWFNLTMARVSGVMTVSLNGKAAFSAPMNFSVNGFALRPWRSTLHARSMTLCATQLPAQGLSPCPRPPPPDPHHMIIRRQELFAGGFANYTQFRIPALLVIPAAKAKAPHDIVLAFAEARGPNHQTACDSCNTRIVLLRSTDAGVSFGALKEITHANPTKSSKHDWTGNAVPLFDDGTKTNKPPSITLVYSYNNNYVLYKRSTDAGVSFGASVNISDAAHPPGTAWQNTDYFTGPGGGIQLAHGTKSGRLVVPAIAIYSTSKTCKVSTACWLNASRDHALVSDDG